MTKAAFVICFFSVALVVGAIILKSVRVQKLVALMLLIALLINCTFLFDATLRSVALQAQKNGEYSKDFFLGLDRLSDALFTERVFSLLIGFLFFVLIFFQHGIRHEIPPPSEIKEPHSNP